MAIHDQNKVGGDDLNDKSGAGFYREKVIIQRDKGGVQRNKTALDRKAPDFDSMFDDDGNPLDDLVALDGIQENVDQEMSAILKAIIERKRAQAERFRITDDPEYFLCLCFQSRDQKNEFIMASGWGDLGEKYINGLEVARRLGVSVNVIQLEPPKLRGRVKNYQRKEVIDNG